MVVETPMAMDSHDLILLRELQRNGRATNVELAEKAHLSESSCQRRVRQLEAAGAIERYAAVVSQQAVGLPLNIFVTITLESQSEASLKAFEREIGAIPEVMECYLMTGESDYQLRVLVASLAEFEDFLRHKLTKIAGVAQVTSSFALRPVVYTTQLPLRA